MTKSEKIFESFCWRAGIQLKNVETAAHRTPDYELSWQSFSAIVEVKEITPNPEEKRLSRLDLAFWEENECTYYGGNPGARIRKKISDGIIQLKSINWRALPTMLIIANFTDYQEILDEKAISVAMFGEETALISEEIAPEGGAEIIRRWHGGSKTLTPGQNTSLSAICILKPSSEIPQLDVYHNPFAKSPIKPQLFSPLGVTHFKASGDVSSNFVKWEIV